MLYRVDIRAKQGTRDCVNTLHLLTHNDLVWTFSAPDTPEAVVAEVDTQLRTLWKNILTPSWTLDSIGVTEVTDPNNPSQVPRGALVAVNQAGVRTVGNENLPPQLCGRLSLYTELRGRSFRGRMFLPPCETDGAFSADLINTAGPYWTAMVAIADKLNNSFSGGSTYSTLWTSTWSAKWVVYSRTRHRQATSPYHSQIKVAVPRRDPSWIRSRKI